MSKHTPNLLFSKKAILFFFFLILFFSFFTFAFDKKTIPEDKLKYYQDVLKFGTINDIKKVLNELIIYDCTPLLEELLSLLYSTEDVNIKVSVLNLIKDMDIAKPKIEPYIKSVFDDKFADNALIKLAVMTAGNLKMKDLEDRIYTIFTEKENEQDTELRKTCLESLGNMLSDKYMKEIFDFYVDTKNNDEIRAYCALYFSKFDTIKKEYIEKMNEIAADSAEDTYVRRYTLYALGKFKDPSSFDAIKKALSSDDPYIQIYAAQAIRNYDIAEAKKVLFSLIRSNNAKVRLEVIKIFNEFNAVEYIEAIMYLALYDSDSNVKKEARGTFLKMLESLNSLNFDQDVLDKIKYLLNYMSKYDPLEENRIKAGELLKKFFPDTGE